MTTQQEQKSQHTESPISIYRVNDVELAGMTVMAHHAYRTYSVNKNAPAGDTIIEYAARLCYNSQEKIHTTDTFLPGLIKAGHLDVFEHASIVLLFSIKEHGNIGGKFYENLFDLKNKFPYVKIAHKRYIASANTHEFYIGFNYRVALDFIWWAQQHQGENELADAIVDDVISSLSAQSNIFHNLFYDEEKHKNNISIYFEQMHRLNKDQKCIDNTKMTEIMFDNPSAIEKLGDTVLAPHTPEMFRHTSYLIKDVSRSFTHQHVRHRLLSHSQKSQRYIDYSVDIDSESNKVITKQFIIPKKLREESSGRDTMYECLGDIMTAYERMRAEGAKKEDARAILPNAARTSIVSSAYKEGWDHYFVLRCAKDAQQEIRDAAIAIRDIHNDTWVYNGS